MSVWVRQVRPGGLIVVPLAAAVHPEWPLAVLRVGADGTARGRCIGLSPFMPLRERVSAQSVREAAGRPEASRFGVTVTQRGQRVWMDSPDDLVD